MLGSQPFLPADSAVKAEITVYFKDSWMAVSMVTLSQCLAGNNLGFF